MSKITFRLLLLLLLISIALSAFITLPEQQDREMSNFYQHRWIITSDPDTDQDVNSIAKYLAEFDVIFFGELHTHSGVHLAQMQLLEVMAQLNPEITLSMEQFERDTQSYVDDYLDGKIGEKHFIEKARAWGNYTTSYRPLVEFARHHQLPVIAANAPKDTVICVGRYGLGFLDELSPKNRQYIAQDIDISAGAYRDKFISFLAKTPSHGSTHEDSSDDTHDNASDNKADEQWQQWHKDVPCTDQRMDKDVPCTDQRMEMSEMMQNMLERSFTAQSVRDDTMAESISLHLQNHPQQQVLHLNGVFHSSEFLGTVERLGNRMPELKIAVIETVPLATNNKNGHSEKLNSGNVLLLVNKLPVAFVEADNELEWSKAILEKRKKGRTHCDALKQP